MLSSVGEGWCNWDASQWPIQSVLFARSMLHLGMSRVFGKGYVSRAGAQHPCLQIHRCTNLAILIFQGVWMLQLGSFPMACPSFMLFISRCLDVATGKLPNGMSKLYALYRKVFGCCNWEASQWHVQGCYR